MTRDRLVPCPCGSLTLPTFARYSAGVVINCWIALDADGRARPGCKPDERTAEIIPRRNARLDLVLIPSPPERPVYRGGAKTHCSCGRTAYVLTTNLNALTEPPMNPDPLDPSVPRKATSCWLSIAEDGGPQEGCKPDGRTWDVLSRARGISAPKAEVILEVLPAVRPSDEARLELIELRANAGRRGKPKPVEPAPPPEEPEGPELSLFG